MSLRKVLVSVCDGIFHPTIFHLLGLRAQPAPSLARIRIPNDPVTRSPFNRATRRPRCSSMQTVSMPSLIASSTTEASPRSRSWLSSEPITTGSVRRSIPSAEANSVAPNIVPPLASTSSQTSRGTRHWRCLPPVRQRRGRSSGRRSHSAPPSDSQQRAADRAPRRRRGNHDSATQ